MSIAKIQKNAFDVILYGLHRKNQAPEGTWSFAKGVTTISWFIILSRQLNYNIVETPWQVKY